MLGRRSLALSTLAILAACAQPQPVVQPQAPSPPPPPATLEQRVRREGWLTRFWEQLTPAQRRRVLARMRRGNPPQARTQEEAAPIWDGLGLPERDALVFGRPPPRSREAVASGSG
jgi:hypothetical protein